MPTEPRWLPAREAADYVGMDTEGFRRAVRRGTLPAATYRLGRQSPRWDRLYTASADQERMATAAIVRLQTKRWRNDNE